MIQNSQPGTDIERLTTVMQEVTIKLAEEYKIATHNWQAQIFEIDYKHRMKNNENQTLIASLHAVAKRSENLEQQVKHLEQQIDIIKQEKEILEQDSKQELTLVRKELEESKRQVEQRNRDSAKELERDRKKPMFQPHCFL